MRVMVFGATGMLGHKLCQVLIERDHTVIGTVRPSQWPTSPDRKVDLAMYDAATLRGDNLLTNLDLLVNHVAPQVVINCIGIVPSSPADQLTMILVNAVFPWALGTAAERCGARLIHISTDCVFSGLGGPRPPMMGYVEDDCPNGTGWYALTKRLGEVSGPNCLTLRTSFIGPSPYNQRGLLEWALSKAGSEIEGWTESIFNGLTTLALSGVIADLIEKHPDMTGLWHVSGQAISKGRLLCYLNVMYNLGLAIKPVPFPRCNRSLCSQKFRTLTGFVASSWPEMLAKMKEDIP